MIRVSKRNNLNYFSALFLQVIRARVPLAELLGYSKQLRIGTSGNATFTMEFDCYKEVQGKSEKEVIKEITGFYPT